MGRQCVCDNCGHRCDEDELLYTLGDVVDLAERLDPGGVVPAGECPGCDALIYLEVQDG
jgi:hypothetical protein